MQIPASIIQGDTVTWRDASTTDNLGNVIDSTWTLTWYFVGPTTLNVTGTASGTGWETNLSAAQTGALTATTARTANYSWQARASKAGRVITVGSGSIRIDPSFATVAAGFDTRTPAEVTLSQIQATIAARISGGAVAEYMIGTRRLRNEPLTELITLESRYKLIVARERRAELIRNGQGDPRNTYVRFS